ncbi:MAG: hypothetical protein Q9162_005421 [Coniocarpon cinnabarinum]
MASRPPAIKAEGSTPMGMGMGMPQPVSLQKDPRSLLPTFIYDYFLKTRRPDLAKTVLDANIGVLHKDRAKASPSGRDVNGIADGLPNDEISRQIEKLPVADIGESLPTESFLQEWFSTFWDIWQASSKKGYPTQPAEQFLNNANRMRQQSLIMNNARMPANRVMGNGITPMQNQAMMNNINRRNPMMPQNQMAQPGAEGQRPQSPMSGDNQPSPKRQRLDGGFPQPMGAAGNPGAPGQPPTMPNNIDPAQFSLMNGMGMMDAENRMGNPQGGALADYQMQLMLLEQQNKRRLLMARQEQEVVSGTGPPGATPQPAMMTQQGMPFNNMHPQMAERRNGQSPSPNDPMKRNPSQLGQSPRPDGLAASRGSPAPGGMFDPNGAQQAPMGNQQFYNMRPNGIGPGAPQGGFQGPNGPMRPMGGMPGPRPGAPGGQFPPSMHFPQNAQQQPPNPNNPNGNPQVNQPAAGSMPPPPGPANPTGRTNPPSPAQGQAPPTPRQGKEGGPKKKDSAKKDTAKGKQQPKKAGATPSGDAEPHPPTPTPSTPVDPHPPPNPLSKTQPNGTQQPTTGPNGMQAQPGQQPDAMAGMDQPQMAGIGGVGDANVSRTRLTQDDAVANVYHQADNNMGDFNFEFGGPTGTDVLDGFDFDSFLQVDGDANGFDFANQTFDMNAGMGPDLAENAHG